MTLIEFISVVDDNHPIFINKVEHRNGHNAKTLVARLDTGTTTSMYPTISPGASQRELTAYPDMRTVHQYLRCKVICVRTNRDGHLEVVLE